MQNSEKKNTNRYEMKMRATEERMRALGLLTPMSVLTLDEWEIPRDRVVINRWWSSRCCWWRSWSWVFSSTGDHINIKNIRCFHKDPCGLKVLAVVLTEFKRKNLVAVVKYHHHHYEIQSQRRLMIGKSQETVWSSTGDWDLRGFC